MALLYYANIEPNAADRLLRNVFYGLSDFYNYLNTTQRFMESDAAVLRLAWRPSQGPALGPEASDEDKARLRAGFWVELAEPKDRPEEPERTFQTFLHEQQETVYELVERERRPGARPGPRRFRFDKENALDIIDRDGRSYQLCLSRRPKSSELLIRPNTYTLFRQLQAIRQLQDAPRREHLPLVRLLQSLRHARWESFVPERLSEQEWLVLTPRPGEPARPGTSEQRAFVEKALATPDFAILEGPPGSGKTTVICELILQMLRRGQRVLLCASTHVAVDNVIERLMDEQNPHRNEVIPVRIGDRSNISAAVREYQLEEFRQAERRRLVKALRAVSPRSPAQQLLLEALQRPGNEVIDRLILDSANLVCGTSIGILQHPDIKNNRAGLPLFDALIVDEASKTTFQEFLVPALLARRWILVGDPRQLSPYVEETALGASSDAGIPDETKRNACVDVFRAAHQPWNGAVLVSSENEGDRDVYERQAKAHGVDITWLYGDDEDAAALELATSSIVIGAPETLAARQDELPLDLAVMRGTLEPLDRVSRRMEAHVRRNGGEPLGWGEELAWRLSRHYEKRWLDAPTQEGDEEEEGDGRLPPLVEQLLPAEGLEEKVGAVRVAIDRIRRVALPSILESLQLGFERHPSQREGTALSDGLPEPVLEARHVLLTWQHRMHPECSRFSREHIYEGEALRDPADMAERRGWKDPPYERRMIWLDVRGKADDQNRNRAEVDAVLRELERFRAWARVHTRPDGKPWEVAVLTFYRGQERALQAKLRALTGQHKERQSFVLAGPSQPLARLELCTVDRFQGHEADLVLLSFVRTGSVGFLDSPNRLNVALTRGRYQTVLVGDRIFFLKGRHKSELLRALAESIPSNINLQEVTPCPKPR